MASAAPASPISRIEAEVLQARAFIEKRQFGRALAGAQALLAEVPENRDVLYISAVCQRYLGQIAEALRTLERLESHHPDYGRLFQERGHCLRAVREPTAAIASYQQAVALNSTLSASWSSLADLYRAMGQVAEAHLAAANVEALAKLPAPVVAATNVLSEGDLYGAEDIVRRFLLKQNDNVEAMRLLAKIGVRQEVLDDAEFLLESVLLLAPEYRAARQDYANVLLLRHKFVRALEETNLLLKWDPKNRDYQTLRATAHVGLGNHEEALTIYRKLVAESPRAADLHLSIAHALKTIGQQSLAVEAYRTAARVQPGFGDAYWSLANLKTYRFTDDEVAQMTEFEAGKTTARTDRFHLCFALGKALEDQGKFAESFTYYERGNTLKRSESRFDIETIERSATLQTQVCTREFFAARAGVGCKRPDPIFIVGLPRAGSTLLEQILASHSQVEGTMELAEIPRLALHLQGRERIDVSPRYPGVLADLTTEDFQRFGEKYLEDTKVFRSNKPYFIDKMPNNFRHIGLIHLILPNAKIIDARREPMACCFSNFKQLYASGQEFTYSVEDVARYYRCYVELMNHWDEALPGKILRVQHEDVVDDLDANVRRILDFCELAFESSCLEFHKTSRSVRTASSEQVRQPIYKDGLDQWRHFEPWLEPLKRALNT